MTHKKSALMMAIDAVNTNADTPSIEELRFIGYLSREAEARDASWSDPPGDIALDKVHMHEEITKAKAEIFDRARRAYLQESMFAISNQIMLREAIVTPFRSQYPIGYSHQLISVNRPRMMIFGLGFIGYCKDTSHLDYCSEGSP